MSGGSQIFFGAATPACWTVSSVGMTSENETTLQWKVTMATEPIAASEVTDSRGGVLSNAAGHCRDNHAPCH